MYKGKLVNLRQQTLSDMAILADFQNQEHIIETYVHDLPKFAFKEKLEKEFKERLEKHTDNEIHLTIETKEGKVIGEVGLDFVFWKNGFGYLYLYIGDADCLEGGYREDALALFVEFAFMENNVRKLKTQILCNDSRNLNALKASGFEIEVVHKAETLRGGKYLDVYEFALLRENYKA